MLVANSRGLAIALVVLGGVLASCSTNGGGAGSKTGGSSSSERVASELPVPSGVKATKNECGRVRVTWKAVDGEYTYDVLRSETSSIDKAEPVCTSTSQTVCLDEEPAAYHEYSYWVKSRDKEGKLSGPSSRVVGQAQGPMSKPQGLTASDGLKNEIVVRWTRVDHAQRYEIQERSCDNPNQPWSTLDANVPAVQNPKYVHRKSVCSQGTASEYRVRAVNVCGDGPWSDVDCGWCTDR